MKLKGLANRAYNILFHTHTVAGITISFALFVIFYAGAFALFRHEIYQWENPEARFEVTEAIDLDKTIAAVEANKTNFAETEIFTIVPPNHEMPFIRFYGAEYEDGDTSKIERFSALINANDNYQFTDLEQPRTTVGNTLYHLHYFRQIPFGIHISGLVALFFLFASITGLLIHWRNLITKFYAFTMGGKWKQIWTNAHTVLGVIGLPFQIVYAVTGALFGLLTLLLLPSALVLFGGDTDKVLATVRPDSAIKVSKDATIIEHAPLKTFYNKVKTMYPEIDATSIRARNYGREDGYVTVFLDDHRTIHGFGQVIFALKDGSVLSKTEPYQMTYTESVLNTVTKLHFATFGGLLLKVVYFILAMITCFMFLSGVLLWKEARNNKRYTEQQKQFHHRVTKIYLAICLGLFPATALIFIGNKLVPMDVLARTFYVNTIFFTGWFALIIAGLFWNNLRQLNKNYLKIGGLLSLLVPVANGLITSDWFWNTIAEGHWYVASVDLFWLFTGISALVLNRYISNTTKEVEVQKDEKISRHIPVQTDPSLVYKKMN